jgi:hypothetical protein
MSEYLERIADLTKVSAVYQEKIRSLEAKLTQRAKEIDHEHR